MADKASNNRREQRLAQQLRANLMRRKQQARNRQEYEKDPKSLDNQEPQGEQEQQEQQNSKALDKDE